MKLTQTDGADIPLLDSAPGTYVLILSLDAPTELKVGRLGRLRFDSPYYLYFGSALGPGGLRARIDHHLRPPDRGHWHVDYLRQSAEVVDTWYAFDTGRQECDWAKAALQSSAVSPVLRFGSSDCRCQSHLLASSRYPKLSWFNRCLGAGPSDRGSLQCLRISN